MIKSYSGLIIKFIIYIYVHLPTINTQITLRAARLDCFTEKYLNYLRVIMPHD
jgi:hypothetical protein